MFELGKLMYEQGVRGEQNADNKALSRFSAIDCIKCCGNKKYKTYQAAKAKWDRLVDDDSDFKDELLSLTVPFKAIHHTNGTYFETPGMTLVGIKILLFILGGDVAMEFRRTVDMLFTRFIAGDESLVSEIRANAANNSIMHKTFREALQLEPMQIASASNDDQQVVKRPLDTLLGKRTLETDEDLQFVDKQLTLHERAFELHQKIKCGAIELEKKKAMAELEVKERKKHPDKWVEIGLREKDIELQEREVSLCIKMRDNNIQMPAKATAAKAQQPCLPPSKEKAPVSSTRNVPPPPSKEKASSSSARNLPSPSSTQKAKSTAASGVQNKSSTKTRKKNGATVKHNSIALHVNGQTIISFLTPRNSQK